MKYLRILFAMLVALTIVGEVAAQSTVPVPPNKVPQADGTIQLVPVPPAFVYTPYFIDPTMQYQLYLTSPWTNKSWNGGNKNGLYGFKDGIITVDIMAMPYAKTKVVDGKTVYLWSIYRSADLVIQYDHTRLELLPVETTASSQGNGFDGAVMDATKSKHTVIGDGLIVYHAEALKAPELRTPALAPKYYQWNFGGYMWQSAYRKLGQLKFKVKDDYYLPTWGSQKSFVRLLPSATVGTTTVTTKVDGSPVVGTNVLKDIRTECEDVIFGVPATYKVSHYLSAPTTKFKAGDIIPVQIKIKPDTKPQLISSVATNFVWDINVLELVSLDKTGARASQSSGFDLPGVGAINESATPKDGNAWHNWLSRLGDKTYVSGDTLIVTLNFKVLQDFNTTKVEIVKKDDPRLVGLFVSEESRILGSNIPGADVLGSQSGVTVNGVFAP
jgi:hypothetical protein